MTSAQIIYANTIAELADAIDRSQIMIYRYKREGCPIEKTENGYEVAPVISWLRRKKRLKADRPLPTSTNGQEHSDYSGDFEDLYIKERALKTQAQREREQLKHQVESGQYISLEEVKQRDIERIAAVKTGLMSLPRRLAQELMGLNSNQMEVMMKSRFRELLERFSKM